MTTDNTQHTTDARVDQVIASIIEIAQRVDPDDPVVQREIDKLEDLLTAPGTPDTPGPEIEPEPPRLVYTPVPQTVPEPTPGPAPVPQSPPTPVGQDPDEL